MKTFYLKTKEGEIINKRKCENIECAKNYFSEIKKLEIKDLLNIFVISE